MYDVFKLPFPVLGYLYIVDQLGRNRFHRVYVGRLLFMRCGVHANEHESNVGWHVLANGACRSGAIAYRTFLAGSFIFSLPS